MDHKSSILSHGNSFKLSICLIINFFLKYLSSLKVPSRNGDYFYLLVIRVSFSHLNRNRQDDNKVGMSAAICPLQRFVFFVILKLGVRDHCQQSMFYFMFDQMHEYVCTFFDLKISRETNFDFHKAQIFSYLFY